MAKRTCALDGCSHPHRALSYCNRHYLRFKRFGDPLYATQRPEQSDCAIEGCAYVARVKGWCWTHYGRWRKTGDPTKLPERAPRARSSCSRPDCDHAAKSQGLCAKHYSRLLRTGTSEGRGGRNSCSVEECVRPHRARSYCSLHLQRFYKYGEPGPAFSLTSDGVPRRGNSGYIMLTADGRRMAEHRLVMERALGRELRPDENVHHINGDKADNRLVNLELWSTYQPSGQRVPDKVEWAVEILRRYAPTLLID